MKTEMNYAIKDEKGYNQAYKEGLALSIRTYRRVKAIIEKVQHPLPKKTLEIGCGLGDMSAQMALHFPRTQHYALDISPQFIEMARKKYGHLSENLSFLEASSFRHRKTINSLSALGPFDLIFGNGILHHMESDLDEVLIDMRMLLRKGGQIVFWEPNLQNPYCHLIFKNPYFRRKANLEPEEMAFSKSYITQKLHMLGWQEIHVETRDFLLPNTPKALIDPLVQLSDILDRIPLVNRLAQSLFLSAVKK